MTNGTKGEMPATTLTVAEARKYLAEHFLDYTLKKTSALNFGLNVWDVSALEEVAVTNSVRKRNFRLYSQGDEEDDLAWWEATQGPITPPIPEPIVRFTDEARAYLVSAAKADSIKAGELIYADDAMERATAAVVDANGKEKRVVLKKDAQGKIVSEDYTPLTVTETVR